MRCPAIGLRVVPDKGIKDWPLDDVLVGVGLWREGSVCFHTRRHQGWQGNCVVGHLLLVADLSELQSWKRRCGRGTTVASTEVA